MSTQPSTPSTSEMPAHVSHPQATAQASGDDLMSRVVTGAHDTIDRLADSAAPHVDRLRQAGSQAGVQADHLRELGDAWLLSLRETVRANPLTALAVAIAAGMVLARVTR